MVPVDFSQQSVWALSAAAMLVKKKQGIIHILYVVDSRVDTGKEALEKVKVDLYEFAQNYQQKLGVSIIPNIEIGNVFQTIGEIAFRLGAKMIVMGTHGIKGIQKVIGSYAVRVMLGSKIPVLLIKDRFLSQSLSKIIIPIDNSTSFDIVINKVIEPGQPFQGSVYLFSFLRDMSSFRKRKFIGKTERALKKIISAGFESKSILIQNNIQDFSDAIIRYAQNINADIIAIPLQTKNPATEFQISDTALNLIIKAPFPLWIINPENI